MADIETNGEKVKTNWTIDVQRGLAWTIVLLFGALLIAVGARVVISGTPTDSLELLKQNENALINIVMMIVGYFFGSSKSSQTKDEVQAKVAEKLAEKVGGKPDGPPTTTVTTVPAEPSTTPTTTTVTTTEPRP